MIFQNDGEVNSFEVHVLDNDNNQATNIWALTAPAATGWAEGKVEVSSNGDKEYQVGFHTNFLSRYILKYYFC